MADERGFFKKGIQRYDMSQNLKERAITEHIIKSTWAYHKNNGINISNTEENDLIFTNCIYAGMYAAKYIGEDVESILSFLTGMVLQVLRDSLKTILISLPKNISSQQ